jgi:hypothetical protein
MVLQNWIVFKYKGKIIIKGLHILKNIREMCRKHFHFMTVNIPLNET